MKSEKSLRKWIKRITISLSILVVISFLGGYAFLYQTKPKIKGKIKIHGLQKPVDVWRDTEGVPHVEAENLHDLFRIQGYVTAQDRLFQMDLSRRQASGMLSEVIGEKTVEQDRFFRTLGLRRAAEESYTHYSKKYIEYLEAYAKGVNDYIAEAKKKRKLPVEFTLLRYEPTPWSPVDSLTIGKYMSYDLSGHWRGQVFRYSLLQKLPKEKVIDLLPDYPADAPHIIEELKKGPKVNAIKTFDTAVMPHEFNGSNNWVVSGSKSVSGKPMLANDPHLKLRNPSIWYETHLKSPDFQVSGVIFAGIPGIILGHNQHAAWGVTNVGPDVQDLYLEKQNPKNPDEFLYKGKWETAKVIPEVIRVKGSKDEKVNVRITRHGPVFSEFVHGGGNLSLKWTALEPSKELQAIFEFATVRTWNDFKKALESFHSPAQNFVFASQDGTIGYRANGLIPIRTKGDSLLPVPGWTGEYEWKGYIPWDKLPTVENPSSGFIATANNRVVGEHYPYHLSHQWAQPYRQMRIVEALKSKEKLSMEDMKNLQYDHLNLQAKEFNPLICKMVEKNESGLRQVDKDALKVLKSWNLQDDRELGAPLVFHSIMHSIGEVLFSKEIDKKLEEFFEGRKGIADQLLRRAVAGKPGPWIAEKGGLEKVILTSYQKAVDDVVKLQGSDTAKWKWGEHHKAKFGHPLGSKKPLHLLFNPKEVPLSGSGVTVDCEGYIPETGEVDHGPAWRTIVDLAHPLESLNSVVPGQSGHVLSLWYDDQIEDWADGKYHVTSMNPKKYRELFKLHFIPY